MAWDYAEFSLEREEYLDEMWEKYKEDLFRRAFQSTKTWGKHFVNSTFLSKFLAASNCARIKPGLVSHHISRTLVWIVLQ